jgi:hypothetical protein
VTLATLTDAERRDLLFWIARAVELDPAFATEMELQDRINSLLDYEYRYQSVSK